MYKYFFLAVLVLLSACGTTGHIVFYNFNTTKYDVEKEISNVIARDSDYRIPAKWRDIDKDDYFERIYVYFKSNPEEVYQIGFAGDITDWKHSSICRLALTSQFDGDIWRYESDLNSKKIKRIKKRFETEILSKIKYSYFKSE